MFYKKQTYHYYTAYPYKKRPLFVRRSNWSLRFALVAVVAFVLTGSAVYAVPHIAHVSTTAPPRVKVAKATVPIHGSVAQAAPAIVTPHAIPVPSPPPAPALVATPAPAPPPKTVCSANIDPKLVLVNISQQHMWACDGTNIAYETAVTTGAYTIEGDATPTGTWHIYNKETNLYLTGPGYKDFVQYWIPFYSDYGFHDASWQTFAFGGSEYSTQGSHGCVHLPTDAAAWLYNWAPIGTTVTITA